MIVSGTGEQGRSRETVLFPSEQEERTPYLLGRWWWLWQEYWAGSLLGPPAESGAGSGLRSSLWGGGWSGQLLSPPPQNSHARGLPRAGSSQSLGPQAVHSWEGVEMGTLESAAREMAPWKSKQNFDSISFKMWQTFIHSTSVS